MIPPLYRTNYRVTTPIASGDIVTDQLAFTASQAVSLHFQSLHARHGIVATLAPARAVPLRAESEVPA